MISLAFSSWAALACAVAVAARTVRRILPQTSAWYDRSTVGTCSVVLTADDTPVRPAVVGRASVADTPPLTLGYSAPRAARTASAAAR